MTQCLQIMKVHLQEEDGRLLMISLAGHLFQGYSPNPKTSKLTHS